MKRTILLLFLGGLGSFAQSYDCTWNQWTGISRSSYSCVPLTGYLSPFNQTGSAALQCGGGVYPNNLPSGGSTSQTSASGVCGTGNIGIGSVNDCPPQFTTASDAWSRSSPTGGDVLGTSQGGTPPLCYGTVNYPGNRVTCPSVMCQCQPTDYCFCNDFQWCNCCETDDEPTTCWTDACGDSCGASYDGGETCDTSDCPSTCGCSGDMGVSCDTCGDTYACDGSCPGSGSCGTSGGGGAGDPCAGCDGDGRECLDFMGEYECVDYADPIIFDLTGDGFNLTDLAGGVMFDFFGAGVPTKLAWIAPGATDAWLAIDANHNGRIDNGRELFGNASPQPGPTVQRTGFKALAQYDLAAYGGNGDGAIDAKDAIFSKLRIWIDRNHDGISQPGEMHSLRQMGIVSISLDTHQSGYTDKSGNQFRYRARVTFSGATSQKDHWAYDVILSAAPFYSGPSQGGNQ